MHSKKMDDAYVAFIHNGGDMRVNDNTALIAAAKSTSRPCKLYFVADKWHLPKSPRAREVLMNAIKANGIPCTILESIDELPPRFERVYMNTAKYSLDYDMPHPYERKLKQRGAELHLYDDWSALKTPPKHVYKVFTPFYKSLARTSFAAPSKYIAVKSHPTSQSGHPLLMARRGVFRAIDRANRSYDHDVGTGLSCALNCGVVSMREAVARTKNKELLRQLMWREFYYQIAFGTPLMRLSPAAYSRPLSDARKRRLDMWRRAATEYDYINASIKYLQRTGLMPNRMRMIVAELLTSPHHYGVPWWFGADLFEEWLSDYNLILNRANWLWCADPKRPWSKPAFREFNFDRQRKHPAVVAHIDWIASLGYKK